MFGEKRELTDAEILSTLEHTLLPSVVIEGKEDLFMFRRIQSDMGASKISLFPVGGRSRVLFAFENRPTNTDQPSILFFVDQDEWAFSGIPARYVHTDLLTTQGYSIENDLLRDGDICELFSQAESQTFDLELSRYLDWFALQMTRFIAGLGVELSKFPGRVLDNAQEFDNDCTLAQNEKYPSAMRDQLGQDPWKLTRGKSLMQIVLRQLSRAGRPAKHRSETLMEQSAQRRGAHLERIKSWLNASI